MFPVDAFRSTVEKAVEIFRRHAIRFHLTGGVTSVAYAEPRLTQDIDFVVDNQAASAQLKPFIQSLERSDFLYDPETVRKAIVDNSIFQLLDNTESLKLDIYPRELIPGELDRSENFEVFAGLSLPIASLPDVAASKLIWISKGSHKNRRDLRKIYRVSGEEDRAKIEELAEQLTLSSLLAEVLAESDEIID